MVEQKVHTRMGKIVSGATIVGAILIFLSICLPWFYFSGTAQYYWGTVKVSGWVSAIGTGRLDGNDASVGMWSTSTHWVSDQSDFWYGYLSLAGLILVAMSVIAFRKTYKTNISTLFSLIGGLMTVLAGVIATTCYKPVLFVLLGSFQDGVQGALLYAEQAKAISGLGPWLSIVGGVISIISMVSISLKFDRRNKE